MKRRFSYRTALVALAAGLVFVLAGDRGTQAQSALCGIDPLEVLNLQVKPNVLIAFDSSGSMNDNLDDTQPYGADYKHAKMGGAKRVLRTAIANNASKITFLFGQYLQAAPFSQFNRLGAVTNAPAPNTNPTRFSYWVRNDDCTPNCPTINLNNIFAFQTISGTADTDPVNNDVLVYQENGQPDCVVPIAPGFYNDGNALAAAMATAMNTCPGRGNNYNVTWSGTNFSFARAAAPPPTRTFQMRWSQGANSVRAVLNAGGADTALGNGPFTTGDARIRHLQRRTTFTENILGTNYTHQELVAGKFWNGETIYATTGGAICGQATPVTPVVPPVVYVQQVSNCLSPGTSTIGPAVPFQFAGGLAGGPGAGGWDGASSTCAGFKSRVDLNACDQDPAPQVAAVTTPFLQDQWEYETAVGPVFGNLKRYLESTNGLGTMVDPDGAGPLGPTQIPHYGMAANGATPIANSLRDLRIIFDFLWDGTPAPPTPPGPVTLPPSGPIVTHVTPREKTIVLFVTDGDDTCAGGTTDQNALATAGRAQHLYLPFVGGLNPNGTFTVGTDPASSVTTYMVGFGLGASPARLDWIAWGGSGMQLGGGGGAPWPAIPTAAQRAACVTCIDAFIAPDSTTLANVLNAIFDQGAQTGDFTAQQSLDAAPYEYVDRAGATFRADDPATRYRGVTPTRFVSTFTMPLFDGHLKAVQAGIVPATRWDAGDVLRVSVQTGMTSCTRVGTEAPAVNGNCFWDELHANNVSDAIVGTSAAKIKRRIYTTSKNGYYGVTVSNLLSLTPPAGVRDVLWPPTTTVAPLNDATEGSLDKALGLPLNSHPNPAGAFADLQRDFRACLGTPLAGAAVGCAAASTNMQKMQRARREAREMILAFMAGAQIRVDSGNNPLRVTAGGRQGQIIYQARGWILADSTRGTPAIIGPPLQAEPSATPYTAEYTLFRDGQGPLTATDIQKGFGLRNPTGVQPVMTVVYTPANDMIHAFRAGPNVAPSSSCTALNECGGQELWGFVPFDRLGPYCVKNTVTQLCTVTASNQAVLNNGTLGSRIKNNPQRRNPHDFMIATGVRVADVFVRGAATVLGNPVQGLWRRLLLVGRGAGGKSLTALDITGPGPFTMRALQTTAPIPLWSRGNPDTEDGTLGGTKNNTTADYDAYLKMGQTWSLPAIGFANANLNGTTRNPKPPSGPGVEFVGYCGSGCSQTVGEGTAFYAFDLLTGDIIQSVDVGSRSGPGTPTYANALVANAAAYSPSRFTTQIRQPHPAESVISRAYMGDLHGRFWKFLAADPSIAILGADLGGDQPVGTAAALLGYDPLGATNQKPHVYVTSGNDSRAAGPFGVFGFLDSGDDVTTATGAIVPFTGIGTPPLTINVVVPMTVLTTGPTGTPPDVPFVRTFDQGPKTDPTAPGPDPVFRGTVQPATALGLPKPPSLNALATTFFAGTRFNPPGTAYAPKPPPYPCRSTFDTIVYVLEGGTGNAAYDLNATGDDAYAIFQGSRTVAIGMKDDPGNAASGSKFERDEGILGPSGIPNVPPPPGLPPGSADVRIVAVSGRPMPAIKFGSTVCQ